MSAIPHAIALRLAEAMMSDMRPFVERIAIVGSLRRMRPEVSDFELLFIPRILKRQNPEALFDELCDIDLAAEYLDRLLAAGILDKRPGENGATAWGQSNKLAIHVESGMPCDFFSTTAENWAMSLVVRTGGKANNIALTTAAQAQGERMNAYGCGFTLQNGTVIPMTSERQIFAHVGMNYLEPEDRP